MPNSTKDISPTAGQIKLLRSRESRELQLYLLAVVTIISIGVLGFSLIEGWGFLDSLYMTVITLSTVGFREVHPLSPEGEVFTIILIFLGVGVAMAVLPRLAGKVIERQLRWVFDRGDMQESIDNLNGHAIFCGFGRLCQIAARQYSDSGRALVIVDSNPKRVEEAQKAGYTALLGDATIDETLIAAGVKRASQLASLMPKDSDNLYCVLTAHEINPALYIITRADDQASEKRLSRAGASRILSPYRVGGQKIANGLLRPYVTDFLDLASSNEVDRLQIEEIRIPEKSSLAGLTIQSAELRRRTNIIVAAMINKAGKMIVNPAADTVIEAGSTLIGFGQRGDFTALEALLEK